MSVSDTGLAPTPGPDHEGPESESSPSAPEPRDPQLSHVERRVAWRASDERRRMFRNGVWVLLVGLAVAIGLAILIAKADYGQHANGATYLNYAGYGAAGWVLFAVAVSGWLYTSYRQQFADRRLLEAVRSDVMQAEEDAIVDGEVDFVRLWRATQRRIDLYHEIATRQAKDSFRYGQGAAGVGFGVIVIAGIIALFARTSAASVAAAITGVAGGGLGAYIGATFMRSQDVASAQLRDYFRQPLELSKFLAAERLVRSLDAGDRPAAVARIVDGIVVPGTTSDYGP